MYWSSDVPDAIQRTERGKTEKWRRLWQTRRAQSTQRCLQSLRIVDGRETDVFDDNHRTGLFDPSIFETKGCMPASYSMTVKRDIEEGMSLLARYLRVTDFVNPIFAYRLSSADPELVSTQLTACMKELKEDYHVQIIRSGNDNSLLVAFVRQARFVNVGELSPPH